MARQMTARYVPRMPKAVRAHDGKLMPYAQPTVEIRGRG